MNLRLNSKEQGGLGVGTVTLTWARMESSPRLRTLKTAQLQLELCRRSTSVSKGTLAALHSFAETLDSPLRSTGAKQGYPRDLGAMALRPWRPRVPKGDGMREGTLKVGPRFQTTRKEKPQTARKARTETQIAW